MRRSRSNPNPGGSRRFPRGLLSAAVCFGVLWVGVVALASAGVEGVPLLVLGCAGVVGTAALLPLVRRREAELEGLSRTDPLTGLANHRGFHQALARQLERARLGNGRLALVMLDVDHFKAVNDAHGHSYGDEVLRSIGKRVRIAVSGQGTAARVGGEEFALIIPDRDAEGAYEVAERARDAVSTVPVRGIELSCSAGVAAYPDDAEDAANLCQLAEGALHWAKRRGKRHRFAHSGGGDGQDNALRIIQCASQIVRRVESRFGLRLLTRTTRSVAPTEAGERLLRTLVPALEELDASLAALGSLRERPAGTIRITSVEHAAKTVIWPKLVQLLQDFPEIAVEISLAGAGFSAAAPGVHRANGATCDDRPMECAPKPPREAERRNRKTCLLPV